MKNRILSSEEVRNVMDNYGYSVVDQFPFKDGNTADTITKIKTTSGEMYVVKIYEPRFSRELIDFHARVSNHLRYQDIPTPQVHTNRSRDLVSTYKDRNYIVMDFLQGDYPKKDSQDTLELVFSTLSKVLVALGKFRPEKVYQQGIYSIPLSEQLRSFQDLLPSQLRNPVDEYVLAYQERLSKLVHLVEKRVNSLKTPSQIIMGDFNLETLLVSNGKLTGVLDFDFVHENRRVLDLIHSIDLFCIDKETEGKELDERVDWDRVERCMKAYSQEDREISEQIDIAPLMLQLKGLPDVIRVWRKGYDPKASDKEREYFKRRIKFFVYRTEVATELGDKIIKHLRRGYKQAV